MAILRRIIIIIIILFKAKAPKETNVLTLEVQNFIGMAQPRL